MINESTALTMKTAVKARTPLRLATLGTSVATRRTRNPSRQQIAPTNNPAMIVLVRKHTRSTLGVLRRRIRRRREAGSGLFPDQNDHYRIGRGRDLLSRGIAGAPGGHGG